MDNNTYYTCECVYFDTEYILCKICDTWVNAASTAEPMFCCKRWYRKSNALNKKSKT